MKKNIIKFQLSLVILVAGVASLPTPLQAYQVWTSTAFTPNYVLDRLPEWDRVAAGVQGLNINFTPIGFLPGEKPDTNEWKQILQTYPTGHQYTFQPFARSSYESNWGTNSAGVTLDDYLQGVFIRAADWGYTLKYIMLYDDRVVWPDGPIYYWSTNDLADVRTWLNTNGHTNVKILWDVRQDAPRERNFSTNTNVGGVLMECNTLAWATNANNRYTFLNWFITNSTKSVIFQIPLVENEAHYSAVRLFVRSLSATILGSTNFVGTDRCVILPMVYSSIWEFLPEYEPSGDQYGDSMTGLLLSLMEQKAKFEGSAPGGLISVADCNSYVRTNGVFIAVSNGNLTNPATWGRPVPVLGDTNVWQAGSRILSNTGQSPNQTLFFYGETLTVKTNGILQSGANGATFSLNNLVLSGGMIRSATLNPFTLALNGMTFTMEDGQIQSGGTSGTQDILFQDGNLAGHGTIYITGAGAVGSEVEFQDTMATTNFRGTFKVCTNGILNLSSIPIASFGLDISDTGKYRNDADVAVTSLTLGGIPVPSGSYAYTDFSAAQQAFLLTTNGQITVKDDRIAITNGNLTAPTTWGMIPPERGDTNIWKTGTYRLGADGLATSGTLVVYGGTLVIQLGGQLDPQAAGAIIAVQNLVLDGGLVTMTRFFPFTVDLMGNTFTLNSGTIQAGGISNNRNVVVRNGSLSGNGTINITAQDTAGYYVEFQNSMNMAGFRGVFNVVSNGILNLPALTNGTFGLNLSDTGRYANDTDVALTSLVIDGVSMLPGSYGYTDFSAAQRLFLVNTNGRITVVAHNAVASGSLTNYTTWGETPPATGDTGIWNTGTNSLSAIGISNLTTLRFYGKTLVVQSGGQLNPDVAGATISLNNLVLDGGTITTTRFFPITIDLNGKTFSLNGGTLQAGKVSNNRTISFRNGVLAGSGDIAVTALDDAGYYIEFQKTINLGGFSGVFNVVSNGTLKLPAITNATFGLNLSGTGKYANDTNVALTSLVIAGVSLSPGTYHYANFTTSQKAFLGGTNGIITVQGQSLGLKSMNTSALADAPYQQWSQNYNLVGGKNGDDDGDGELNYYEYALGGNPTNAASHGYKPICRLVTVGGTNWLEYVHLERTDVNPVITQYRVETTDGLATPKWTTNAVNRVGTGTFNADFNVVTNRVSIGNQSQQFLRLEIQ